MRPLLAPLVENAPVVTVMGLCKNAGKTTALCRLLAELVDERLAVTSVGRDGERTDIVTGTEKPEIWVREGTLFATAKGLLPLCDVSLEVVGTTDVATPLGNVAVFCARSDGYVQLAGPSAVGQLDGVIRMFRELGAQRVLIDGAAGRKSLAAAGEDGCAILCTGASLGSVEEIVAETAHVCNLFAAESVMLEHQGEAFALFDGNGERQIVELGTEGLPVWSKLPRQGATLWVQGGVTTPMLNALARQGGSLAVAVPDATHFLFDRVSYQRFVRLGGSLRVERKLTIAAVCANPRSAYGTHLDREVLLDALRAAVTIPVVDVKEDAL